MSALILKIIACAAMLADHIAYTGLVTFPLSVIFRCIGRIAFPVFCMLIVNGMEHTANLKKYHLRLLCAGIISEIPYDYCFYGKIFYPDDNNVMFTLLLGLAAISVIKYSVGLTRDGNHPVAVFLGLFTVALLTYAAELLNTDYTAWGVLLIISLYVLRNSRAGKAAAILVFSLRGFIGLIFSCGAGFPSEFFKIIGAEFTGFTYTVVLLFTVLSVPLILCYNGSKGLTPRTNAGRYLHKYSFYVFYPLHLLLIGIISNMT